DPAAGQPLLKIIDDERADPHVLLEAIAAIGSVKATFATDSLLDLFGDPSPTVRAAALGALAKLDPENFMFVLSGMDQDAHWSVRAALATILAAFPADVVQRRLTAMLKDGDQRVIPSVLAAMAAVKLPGAADVMIERLKADDLVVRGAA